MAGLTTTGNGLRRIDFTLNGQRRFIRLGRMPAKQAEQVQRFVEDLAFARASGGTPKPATADWLASIDPALHDRLSRAGLIEPPPAAVPLRLGPWLAAYVQGRQDVKASTATVYGHTRRCLLAFFGEARSMDTITPGDADAFRVHLKTAEGLAENTIRRRLGIAKQFFRAAVRKRLLGANPFDGQATVVRENPTRFHFVTREQAAAVLDACPDAQWRLIFALARFGGLRCPSEILALTWADVNWEKARFTVHASKTEHHADGGERLVPIFPELLPYLRECFELAEPGAVHVVTRYRDPGQNLRTQLGKIIRRAGLKPWPKLWQNLRSTRQTELCEEFPTHVVCEWIGNSPQVAAKHYLQTTEDHFTRAIGQAHQNAHHQAHRNAHPNIPATIRTEPKAATAEECKPLEAGNLGATLCNSAHRSGGGLDNGDWAILDSNQ